MKKALYILVFLLALVGIGYLVTKPGGKQDIVTKELPNDGFILIHRTIAGEAYLLDMTGRRFHSWKKPIKGWEWDYVELLPNGDLIVVIKEKGILILDWNNQAKWNSPEIPAHHDIERLPSGAMYVVANDFGYVGMRKVLMDAIVKLEPTGELPWSWRLVDHLEELDHYDAIVKSAAFLQEGDSLSHMNSVSLVPPNPLSSDPRFRPGNLMATLRNFNTIIIIDKESEKIVWQWGSDRLDGPHHGHMLPNGRIVVFDNGRQRGYSQVLELDPKNKKVEWEYGGKSYGEKNFFYSPTRGAVQLMPDGGYLVSDATNGLFFWVRRESKELRWYYQDPVIKKMKDDYMAEHGVIMPKNHRNRQLKVVASHRGLWLPTSFIKNILAAGGAPRSVP